MFSGYKGQTQTLKQLLLVEQKFNKTCFYHVYYVHIHSVNMDTKVLPPHRVCPPGETASGAP